MPHTNPMMKDGADLTGPEHVQCAAQFEDMALAAFQEQHIAQEASRGI